MAYHTDAYRYFYIQITSSNFSPIDIRKHLIACNCYKVQLQTNKTVWLYQIRFCAMFALNCFFFRVCLLLLLLIIIRRQQINRLNGNEHKKIASNIHALVVCLSLTLTIFLLSSFAGHSINNWLLSSIKYNFYPLAPCVIFFFFFEKYLKRREKKMRLAKKSVSNFNGKTVYSDVVLVFSWITNVVWLCMLVKFALEFFLENFVRLHHFYFTHA